MDGDGVSEDLSLREDRVKAVRWFLDEALARWKALCPEAPEAVGLLLDERGDRAER